MGDYERLANELPTRTRGSAHADLVCHPDYQAVFGLVVLVLVLDDQATTSLVISLSLTPPAILDLETLVVCR